MALRRCVIVNPASGRGQAARLRPTIERALHDAGIACPIVQTHTSGDAVRLARLLVQQGYDQIIVVGGDGTINEAMTGLLTATTPIDTPHLPTSTASLAFIPIGTGNDFIRSLPDLRPNDIHGAVQRIAQGGTRCIDVGRVVVRSSERKQTRLFLNNLALAIDAIVAAKVSDLQLLKGLPAYLVAALLALREFKPYPLELRYNDVQDECTLLLATVTNGQYQGGGFHLTPDALLDDGLLDLCLVQPMPILQALRYLPDGLRGTHTNLPPVQMARAPAVAVRFTVPHVVVTDGEIISTAAVQVQAEVLPAVLRIVG